MSAYRGKAEVNLTGRHFRFDHIATLALHCGNGFDVGFPISPVPSSEPASA
jgi:hypothetical protein